MNSPIASPAGYVLVPIEPTEEMHVAAVRTLMRCTGNDDFPPRVWRAMLDARPAIETPVQAQLGTGSGAGAQSDSGADSGHATRAVPCLHPSVSEASLHDAFAVAVLQGLCANPGGPFQANDRSGWGFVNCDAEQVADLSYAMADAMLKTRAALATVEAKEKTR